MLIKKGFLTSIVTPLKTETNLLGLLLLSSPEMEVFTNEHLEIMRSAMSQYALTLRNVQLYFDLDIANKNLHKLASHLVSAQEEERQRISLELHDETGQYLTALKMHLSSLCDMLPSDAKKAKEQCLTAEDIIDTTVVKLRTMAQNLRPPALGLVGLDQSLKDMCVVAEKQSGIRIIYSGSEDIPYPDSILLSVYRIVQECLTNILKHSKASHSNIKVFQSAAGISMEISDNGIGFVKPVGTTISTLKLGLIGIRERIQAAGGNFHIHSEPGKGTKIIAAIPSEGLYDQNNHRG
jgi:signal transduction histidine kinase